MDNIRITLRAATLALLIGGLSGAASLPLAKESPGTAGIPPEKVADYVHAVIEADRTIYTTHIVNRMQEKGIVSAAEHWEQDNALPLPAQFLQHSGRLVAESGRGIRYRLIGLSPIYQRNAPATDFERKALETLRRQPERPVTGVVASGKKQFFQAIYPDRAVSTACVTC
ncbi:MAG: c-type heme family protein, partial [Nitrospiraceae bacterium]